MMNLQVVLLLVAVCLSLRAVMMLFGLPVPDHPLPDPHRPTPAADRSSGGAHVERRPTVPPTLANLRRRLPHQQHLGHRIDIDEALAMSLMMEDLDIVDSRVRAGDAAAVDPFRPQTLCQGPPDGDDWWPSLHETLHHTESDEAIAMALTMEDQQAAHVDPAGPHMIEGAREVGGERFPDIHATAHQMEIDEAIAMSLQMDGPALGNNDAIEHQRRGRPELGNEWFLDHRSPAPAMTEADEELAMSLQIELLDVDDEEAVADGQIVRQPAHQTDNEAATGRAASPETDDEDDSSDDEGGELEGRDCLICTEPIRGRPAFEDRNHEPICRRCERKNVKTQIRSSVHPIRCCNRCCTYTHEELMQMLTGRRHAGVSQLLENSMLQRSMEHPWHCPAASCEYQGELEAPPAENRPAMISCPQCEKVSCMACHELWKAGDLEHFGYTCDEFARAKQDGTQAMIRQSTRPCPQCGTRIEKDDGCEHMQCRCGHHFCWTCRQPWVDHDNYFECNVPHGLPTDLDD